MVILSQDKKRTTRSMELYIDVIIGSGNQITYGIYIERVRKPYIKIGEYKTEERAKEVLQEILNKYRQYNLDNNKAVTAIPKVYEIPKE